MARRARIRIAGTTVATALFALAATEVAAQDAPQGEIVLNGQLQDGDVFAQQTLNVVDAQDQVSAGTSAQGNQATGAVQGGEITVRSTQDMRGDAIARTDANLGGDTNAVVNIQTQAGGNYLAVSAYDADMTVEGAQSNTGGLVSAISEVGPSDARLIEGGSVAASATSNSTDLYGEGAFIQGTVDQSSTATVRSFSRIQSQYIPAEAAVVSESAVNAVSANSDATSGQNLAVTQSSSGDFIDADASANAGNAWDLASRARAAANRANLYNQGGSMVVETRQSNSADVRTNALTTAYDFGRAEAVSQAAANEASIGNNDIFVEIDNSQFNSGGVDATATFSGTNGYDAYVGANAAGNSVTGYACADCSAYMDATNTQTNTGNVTATANTTVAGSGRAVITGANAVGNSATFYVSRPGN